MAEAVSSWGVREILKYQEGINLQTKIDDTTDTDYVYIGVANPGTATSADDWSIQRITVATGDVAWAKLSGEGAGTSSFNKEWDERTSYTYN